MSIPESGRAPAFNSSTLPKDGCCCTCTAPYCKYNISQYLLRLVQVVLGGMTAMISMLRCKLVMVCTQLPRHKAALLLLLLLLQQQLLMATYWANLV